jgi:sulfur-oxidizing protein SoxB
MGKRIDDMRLNGKPVEAEKKYKVAGWAPVSEEAKTTGGKPIWDLVEPWLKAKGTVSQRKLNLPQLAGVQDNPGLAN